MARAMGARCGAGKAAVAARVVSLDLLEPLARVDPSSGQARVRVRLEGGGESSFLAATFDRPEAWMKEGKLDHWFGGPVLYVRRLDEGSVREAVAAMAEELGGYWLRYYGAAPGKPSKAGFGTASAERASDGCGVVEAALKDGREFSMLCAAPAWWRLEAERRGLRYYYGPLV